MSKVIQALSSQPWLIQEDSLETIIGIAEERKGESVEALQARLGKPLDNSRKVSIRSGSAIIPVTGPIFRYANLFTMISGATSTEILAQDFAKANDDPEVERIVLEIDSPGGQAPGIADLASLIRESEKEVVAFVDGLGASAAYWIASAADKIVISRSAEVGSIGAVFAIRTDDEQGVITIVSKQSPKKRLDPKTESGVAELQERINNIAQVFVNDVASFRGVDVEKVLSDFGQGGLLLGQAAVDAGMADRVGTFESLFKNEEVSMSGTGITLESVRADHPDVASALEKEGYDKGFAAGKAEGKIEGQKAEVERIKAVRDLSVPGHEAMIETFMFDGKTTGPEAAVAIVHAQKKIQETSLKTFKEEAPEVLNDLRDTENSEELEPVSEDDKIKAEWNKSAETRAEFAGDFETFVAFKKNEQNIKGEVK